MIESSAAASPASFIVNTSTRLLDSGEIEIAVDLLEAGELVAIPTETVYGLAADAEDATAVGGIFEAKGRPPSQPLIVHIRPEWVERYAGHWPQAGRLLAEAFWPGPLTIVVPKTDLVPPEVTGGLASVGLRAPSHPVAIELLDRFGRGLAAPSANRYGHVSPTTAQHVLDDLDGRIAAVVESGPSQVGVESTIVAIDDDELSLLRRGAVTKEQMEAATKQLIVDRTQGPVRAPGMVLSHYAPAAPVEVVSETAVVGADLSPDVLVISAVPVSHARSVFLGDHESFAAGLYDALRLGDDPEVTQVLVVPPRSGELVPAIMDRLRRASHR